MKKEPRRTGKPDDQSAASHLADQPVTGVLPLDVKKYEAQMEEFDFTDEQRVEILQTLWTMMATFVDLGFGTEPVQHFLGQWVSESLQSPDDRIKDKSPSSRFNEVALENPAQEESL